MSKKVIPCETYSRITGFYRPVQQWNAGKQEEYKDRKTFDVNKSIESKAHEVKPDYTAISDKQAPFPLYLGVKMCSECENIFNKIKNKEINGLYFGFNDKNKLAKFIRQKNIEIDGDLTLPICLESENI